MIHLTEHNDMHIAKVTWHEERRDLPPAIVNNRVAARPSLYHQMDELRVFADPDNVATAVERADVSQHPAEEITVCIRKLGMLFELHEQGMSWRCLDDAALLHQHLRPSSNRASRAAHARSA
ncbi:hypothetical protein SPHINGO391_310028 [Sphingomonas aurantiaca]|uniref:Uncharacterized protein n=1 Tax=Sphingomonas aurantiaca TaxID=185949 RepID=A0A5E7XZP9_9SPHN|nr:hypothetical protein SPHINGO391_310028 [Sphingomonas aurantiaca]